MSALLDDLAGAVSTLVTDPAAMEGYRRDQCLLTEAGRPAAVVIAKALEEVAATVRVARKHRVPLVTRGAGTGLAGAANAIDGCIVLVLSRLDRILAIDPIARSAVVQPGVLNGDLDRAAAAHGLWYAPDPGSRAISTIGGNLATNAGGMCCAKYGVTADHVQQLTAVLGTGETVHTGALTRKNVAGLDLTRLLVGSEGTLGIIVEATVRLRRRPAAVATVAASFPTAQDAIATVLELGDGAAAVELMDRTTVRAVNAATRMNLDEHAGAVMLAQFDGADDTAVGAQAQHCAVLAESRGAEVFHTVDIAEGEALMEARRAAYPALERLGATLLDDVAVGAHRMPALLAQIEQIAARYDVIIGTFGHAADGNLHPTIVFDPADSGQRDRARMAFDDIVAAAIEHGGTISGEHGIGVLKQDMLDRQVGSVELALMHRIKAAFDPDGILNPGRAY
ncbi:FAD-linked oxidase [Mycolicibacterium wolinskyi]|uniref:FAD-linked oxidase n=1 Tax=Mycolicibacterium wolinskyi TaxID=59750 RepID=A0A132PTE4_9MYCO|nr:FAD-linked oxidase [Mycolicibacterium wolinskyi]